MANDTESADSDERPPKKIALGGDSRVAQGIAVATVRDGEDANADDALSHEEPEEAALRRRRRKVRRRAKKLRRRQTMRSMMQAAARNAADDVGGKRFPGHHDGHDCPGDVEEDEHGANMCAKLRSFLCKHKIASMPHPKQCAFIEVLNDMPSDLLTWVWSPTGPMILDAPPHLASGATLPSANGATGSQPRGQADTQLSDSEIQV